MLIETILNINFCIFSREQIYGLINKYFLLSNICGLVPRVRHVCVCTYMRCVVAVVEYEASTRGCGAKST
jgi:hypothetical protein